MIWDDLGFLLLECNINLSGTGAYSSVMDPLDKIVPLSELIL
mgnify:CR=1 FL=1